MRQPSAACSELLANDEYHIEFGGFFTNHVKHAVVALHGLGAPDTAVHAYWDRCDPDSSVSLVTSIAP
jgi:hypothetical protein